MLAALGERYRALAPDIAGHGAAAARDPISLQSVLDDIAALTPSRFVLVGYSMGGRLALQAALALPERVQALLLIGASPGIDDAEERVARRAADERLAEEIERSSIEEFARRWATTTDVLGGQPPTVLEAAYEDRVRNTPAGLARALRALGTGSLPSLWDSLGSLRMPVTLVVGERDHKFRSIAEQMAARIDRAALVVVKGAGHAVHLERPDRVARILADAFPPRDSAPRRFK